MPGTRGLRELLAEPHLDRLLATRLAGQFADGVFQASLAGAVFFNPEHATTAPDAAAAFTVLLLPYSLVGPFAGVLLDRWRRARVLVAANLLRAALVAAVAGLLVTAGPDALVFFAAALAALSVSRFLLADLSAALPRVVPDRLLVDANSLTNTAGLLATFAGGGAGVGLRAVVGGTDRGNAAVALAGAACAVLAAGLAAGFADPDVLGPTRRPGVAQLAGAARAVVLGWWEGARHVAGRPQAADALLAITAHRVLYGLWTISTVLVYRNSLVPTGPLRAGLTGLAEILVATGAGTVLAAVATPAGTARAGLPGWIGGLLVVAAATELTLAGHPGATGLLTSAVLLGFVAQGLKIAVDTAVQRGVDEPVRGRVFSFYDTLFNLAFVVAAAIGAVLLPTSGRSAAVVLLISLGYLATAAGYLTAVARRRMLLRPG